MLYERDKLFFNMFGISPCSRVNTRGSSVTDPSHGNNIFRAPEVGAGSARKSRIRRTRINLVRGNIDVTQLTINAREEGILRCLVWKDIVFSGAGVWGHSVLVSYRVGPYNNAT